MACHVIRIHQSKLSSAAIILIIVNSLSTVHIYHNYIITLFSLYIKYEVYDFTYTYIFCLTLPLFISISHKIKCNLCHYGDFHIVRNGELYATASEIFSMWVDFKVFREEVNYFLYFVQVKGMLLYNTVEKNIRKRKNCCFS